MPITNNGFTRPDFDTIEADFKTRFEAKFTVGDNIPSTEPESFLGILSTALAQMKNDLYEDVEDCYYSGYVSMANGVSLERAAYPIILRSATHSTATQRFIGTDGQVIPAGFRVETMDDRQYEVVTGGTIGVSGQLDLTVQSVLTGLAQNAPISAIKYIPTPLVGLTSTSNITPASGGYDIETESEYRAKVIAQREADLTSSLQAIVNRVRNVTGVVDAFGIENVTEDVDIDGRPPGSFEIIVEGGTDNDIAHAIFDSKSSGVESFGDVMVTIVDERGDSQPTYFSRLAPVETFVKVTLTTDASYDSVIEEPKIRQRILEYIGGVDQESVTHVGVGIGEKVYSWKAEASLWDKGEASSIKGVTGVSILLGFSFGAETETVLTVAANQRAFTDFANITILP